MGEIPWRFKSSRPHHSTNLSIPGIMLFMPSAPLAGNVVRKNILEVVPTS